MIDVRPLARGAGKSLFVLVAVGCGTAGGDEGPAPTGLPVLVRQSSGTESLLQAISAVSAEVAWVGGHDGTYVRTTDGGLVWEASTGPGGDSLQFRDVHAFDADRAVLMSAGSGPLSRIYVTEDAGRTWELAFLMEDTRGFLDCLDFWDDRRGLAYGDSFDGVPYVLLTSDGGRTWRRPDPARLPPAGAGEGGFAASGTCARAGTEGRGWIATGAGGNARVLRTADHGRTWQASETPIVKGDVAGLTTLTFRGREVGLGLGGDLAQMEARTVNVVRTMDGGESWAVGGALRMPGPVYGASYVPGTRTAVAVGPAGADWSGDDGERWLALDDEAYWAVDLTSSGSGWLVGPQGRITKVHFTKD